MQYQNIMKAVFLERPNRFVARVKTETEGEIFVYVPNTGRCKEIFVPYTTVYLQRSQNLHRKYTYTLYSAYKGENLIHIDSAAANQLVAEALQEDKIQDFAGITELEREKTFGSSRFDFRFKQGHKTCFMEVKGVTLEEDGIAKFPDAPTERGTRHIYELIEALAHGYGAYLFFVVQMQGVTSFQPHWERDPAFAAAVKAGIENGVKVLVYDTFVLPQTMTLDKKIPLKWGN